MAVYDPQLQSFHIPLSEDQLTLRAALNRLEAIGNASDEVPWLVRLMENPRFDVPPLSVFKGRVTLRQHDCIHLLLGRGTTLIDEAFTIGFTMGSTNELGAPAAAMFEYVAGHLYPKPYRFTPAASRVFRDAVHLGAISNCQPLDEVDFTALEHLSLREVREQLGVETDLLLAYYRVEASRNPGNPASQRLLGTG